MPRTRSTGRQPVATNHCRHFAAGALAGCARAGLAALQQAHRVRVKAEQIAACSVDLDACRQPHEPHADRWDYIVTIRDSDDAIAIEPHPAAADQVDEMIRKKAWAHGLLRTEAPTLRVAKWVWLTGADAEPMFTRNHPAARRLAEAGITFPLVTVAFDP